MRIYPFLSRRIFRDGKRVNTYVSPLRRRLRISVPWNLQAEWIPFHSVEVRVPRRRAVEELSPQQLTVQ